MSLPIFPVNTVLFPGSPLPLHVFEERYLQMLRDRLANDPIFGISLIAAGREVGDQPEFHQVGTTARLVSINAHEDGHVDIVVVGERRIRMSRGDWRRGYAVADVDDLPDRRVDRGQAVRLMGHARAILDTYLETLATLLHTSFRSPVVDLEPETGTFEIASLLPLHTWEQQEILEDVDPVSRIERVCEVLQRELSLVSRGGTAGVPLTNPGSRFTAN
jgi:Lon protease-like protein